MTDDSRVAPVRSRHTTESLQGTSVLLLNDIYMSQNAARINHCNGPSGQQPAPSVTGPVMPPGAPQLRDGQGAHGRPPACPGRRRRNVGGVISAE